MNCLDRDYYDRARGVLERGGETLQYFVFSDEPEKARDLLGDWSRCTFVSGNTSYEDMLLMSLCRHHIIANSTFSWWPAWLGTDERSIVVAPRQWFSRKAQLTKYPLDIFPVGWVLV